MITNYYVLSALATEWNELFSGARMNDAYSHLPAELTIEFELAGGSRNSVRVSTRPGNTFVYAQNEARKPRSNVTSLFDRAHDLRVEAVECTTGDRILYFLFDEGSRLELHPYGSRPNVLWVSDGRIVEAFKRSETLVGQRPPEPRPVKNPGSADEFKADFDRLDGSSEARLKRLYPQFGLPLVREVLNRGEGDLWDGICSVLDALESPESGVYALEEGLLYSPIVLHHLDGRPHERFESVDAGVRFTIKRRSRRLRLESLQQPIVAALEKAEARWSRRLGDLEAAEQKESRADRYEQWAHLLMAQPRPTPPGSDEIALANILDDGSMVTIPLDPDKGSIQNAEKYYDKARRVREERIHLEERLAETRKSLKRTAELRRLLAEADSPKEVERLRKEHAEDLRKFVGGKAPEVESAPFRRFRIAGGFEVWVGRNAKENDALTFEHAARHDLWMHARGVPGSHVVLRLAGRDQQVDRATKERAAAIAAWYSRARGSGLVPVQIAQRKHVTKPRGALPGVVRVQNEEVVLVEPKLP